MTLSAEMISLIIIASALVTFLAIFIPIIAIRSKYKDFVQKHSIALQQLYEINGMYTFKYIPSFDMVHSYDNENYYNIISCQDYLTYQLVYLEQKVSKALKDTINNKMAYDLYIKTIKETCILDTYEVSATMPKNRKWLRNIEAKLFKKQIQMPTIYFSIIVKLILTNINGYPKTSKSKTFVGGEVKGIIDRMKQKRGTYYANRDIWDSICRVERGKVTNKMRFAIYQRDGNRCCICGSRHNLEIDHIFPVSKGGKSTYDNLQTLCHRCNIRKGSDIYY